MIFVIEYDHLATLTPPSADHAICKWPLKLITNYMSIAIPFDLYKLAIQKEFPHI